MASRIGRLLVSGAGLYSNECIEKKYAKRSSQRREVFPARQKQKQQSRSSSQSQLRRKT